MKATMAIAPLLLGLGALASCGASAPATPADRQEVETLLADAESFLLGLGPVPPRARVARIPRRFSALVPTDRSAGGVSTP